MRKNKSTVRPEDTERLRALAGGSVVLHDVIERTREIAKSRTAVEGNMVLIGAEDGEDHYELNEPWEAQILLPALETIAEGLASRMRDLGYDPARAKRS